MSLRAVQDQQDLESGSDDSSVSNVTVREPKDRKLTYFFRKFVFKLENITSLHKSRYPSVRTTAGTEAQLGDHFQDFYEATVFSFGESSLTINLASLHRIELLKLQRQLLQEAFDLRYHKSTSITSGSATSHKYMQALTDWESIKACAAKGRMNDPFILTTARIRDSTLIKEGMEKYLEKTTSMTIDKQADYYMSSIDSDIRLLQTFAEPHDQNQPYKLFGGSRTEMNRKIRFENFLQRLTMAGIGGAFLIGPMLIMVLKKTLLTTLLTTSICVVAFGFTLAVYLDQPFNVLSGTAAYAAVLVVFVGTSSNTS